MEKLGDVEYGYQSDANGVTINMQILWKGQDIKNLLPFLLRQSKLVRPLDLYDRSSKRLHFNPEVQKICNDIFPIFAEIRKKDIYASGSMASHLFEQFTDCWNRLLYQGQDILGIRVWEYALEITEKWEAQN